EIVARPATPPAAVATAPVLQPEIPAIPSVESKTAITPTVAASTPAPAIASSSPAPAIASATPAQQPEPPAIPQVAMKPPAESAQAPVAKPAESPEIAPLPAPAPEMDIPAIPKADEPPAAPLQSKEQTADPGVRRLSADADQANREAAPAPAQPEPSPPPATSPDSPEIKAPTDEQPVKVLQPLPDEEEGKAPETAEKTSGVFSRSENGLVVHFELKNPLRRWTNRQTDEPTFRPRQSGLASLRATTREFYEKSRSTLASRLGGGAATSESSPKPAVAEKAVQVASEPATKPVEQPAPATVETVATEDKPAQQAVASQPAAPVQAQSAAPVQAQLSAPVQSQSAAQPPAASVQPVKASAEVQKPAASTRTASYSSNADRPRMVVSTSSGLPPVEFPASYGQNGRKSANPWANQANPAVPPRITPDLAVASYDSLKSTKPGPELKKPAKADRSIIATSLTVPMAKPEPIKPEPAKPEASKPAPSEKASSGPSLFRRAGTGLKSFFLGEEEVVPAKRQNWSTQNWSGTDRPGMASSGMLTGKNPGFNRLSPSL
ncbi:MAG: hypothetical protein ACKO0V_06665, partial [bacterium]